MIENLKTRNINLLKITEKKGIHNKFTEELRQSIENNYVEKFGLDLRIGENLN